MTAPLRCQSHRSCSLQETWIVQLVTISLSFPYLHCMAQPPLVERDEVEQIWVLLLLKINNTQNNTHGFQILHVIHVCSQLPTVHHWSRANRRQRPACTTFLNGLIDTSLRV